MNNKQPNTDNNLAKQIVDMLSAQLLGQIISITISDAAKEYLAFVKLNKAHKTYIGLNTFINHLLKFFSPLRKVETIRQKDIQSFLYGLRKNAPLAVENYFRIGRTFFNWLIKQNYIRSNPFIGIELPKRQQVNPAFYTLNEANIIWSKLEDMGKIAIRNIVFVGFFTGMRYGELTNLRWRNINFNDKIIIVGDSSFTTKTKRTRVIPMNAEVFNLLNSLKSKSINNKQNENEYVFTKNNKQKLTVDWVSKSFKKAVRELGMDESIHLYSTRHSAASHLVSKGANPYAVKDIMGHQNFLTTQRYIHLNLEDLRKAIE